MSAMQGANERGQGLRTVGVEGGKGGLQLLERDVGEAVDHQVQHRLLELALDLRARQQRSFTQAECTRRGAHA